MSKHVSSFTTGKHFTRFVIPEITIDRSKDVYVAVDTGNEYPILDTALHLTIMRGGCEGRRFCNRLDVMHMNKADMYRALFEDKPALFFTSSKSYDQVAVFRGHTVTEIKFPSAKSPLGARCKARDRQALVLKLLDDPEFGVETLDAYYTVAHAVRRTLKSSVICTVEGLEPSAAASLDDGDDADLLIEFIYNEAFKRKLEVT